MLRNFIKASSIASLLLAVAAPAFAAPRDACALLPKDKLTAIMGPVLAAQDQPPKLSQGVMRSACVIATQNGSSAILYLSTFATARDAAAHVPAAGKGVIALAPIAGTPAVAYSQFILASKQDEMFMVTATSSKNVESDSMKMRKAILALALAKSR